MNNQKKKSKKAKIVAGVVVGSLLISSCAFAATVLLNWTGEQTMVQTGIFIEQVTNKLIKTNTEKNQAVLDKDAITAEKTELEKEIEDLKEQIKDLEANNPGNNPGNNPDEGWTDKDQQIVDLNNQLIEKQNEVDHLTRELQRANDAAIVIQGKLDTANSKLTEAGINIWD